MALSVDDVQQALTTNNVTGWTPSANLGADGTDPGEPSTGLNLTDDELVAMRQVADTDLSQLVAFYQAPANTGENDPNAAFATSAPATTGAVALAVDWRNHKGINAITPVRDQGSCGSCVAFGTIATLESMLWIDHRVSLDLSEAELFWCNGDHPTCTTGWKPDGAISYVTTYGVAQESCMPYSTSITACAVGPERAAEAIQATQSVRIFDVAARKQYLDSVGPMIAGFNVYEDFFHYGTGVYSHVTGVFKGGHCVQIIGYDDAAQCWIAKNSWGTAWGGDAGFFRIGYGQCGIDSTYPFWGISNTRFFTV